MSNPRYELRHCSLATLHQTSSSLASLTVVTPVILTNERPVLRLSDQSEAVTRTHKAEESARSLPLRGEGAVRGEFCQESGQTVESRAGFWSFSTSQLISWVRAGVSVSWQRTSSREQLWIELSVFRQQKLLVRVIFYDFIKYLRESP